MVFSEYLEGQHGGPEGQHGAHEGQHGAHEGQHGACGIIITDK